MKAKELLEANQLSAAVAELTQEVKHHPADSRLRTFLFEVLCFSGEFERAERQLDVIGHQNEKTGIGVEVYGSHATCFADRFRTGNRRHAGGSDDFRSAYRNKGVWR